MLYTLSLCDSRLNVWLLHLCLVNHGLGYALYGRDSVAAENVNQFENGPSALCLGTSAVRDSSRHLPAAMLTLEGALAARRFIIVHQIARAG